MTRIISQAVTWEPDQVVRPAQSNASSGLASQAMEQEAAAVDVEDYQNFIQYYSTVAPHGRLSPMALPREPRWTVLSPGGFDGMAFNFIAARGNVGASSLLGIAVMEGMVVPLADRVPHQPVQIGSHQAELFYGPMLGAWSTAGLFAGEIGLTELNQSWGTHLTLNSNGQARGSVALQEGLEPVAAREAGCFEAYRALCEARELPLSARLRKVELQRLRGPGAQAMPALSLWAQLQILCRIDYTSVCDVTFGTFVDETAANLLDREKTTFWGRNIKSTWRALWGLDLLPVPELTEPSTMQLGDSVVEKRWTRKTFLSALGQLLFFVGYHGARYVQNTIAVHRLLTSTADKATEVKVELGFATVKSGRFWAALAGNLTGHRGERYSGREVMSLQVRLDTPQILEAYQKVVAGARERCSASEQLSRLQALAKCANGAGQNISVNHIEASGTAKTQELGSSFIGLGLGSAASYVPARFSYGMNQRRVHSRHKTIVKDASLDVGDQVLLAGTAHLARRGPDGERATRMFVRAFVPKKGEKESRLKLSLEAHFSLGRAYITEVQKLIVTPLERDFGLRLSRPLGTANLLGAGWRTSREVAYRQDFRAETLVAFARKKSAEAATKNFTSSAKKDTLTTLAREVDRLSTGLQEQDAAHYAERLVDALETFLKMSTTCEVGALAQMLHECEPSALSLLETQCDAYEVAIQERKRLARLVADASADEAAALCAEANKSTAPFLSQVHQLIESDPFLSSETRRDLQVDLASEDSAIREIFHNYQQKAPQSLAQNRLRQLDQERRIRSQSLFL